MIDKSLSLIIFMYLTTLSLLAFQLTLADSFGLTLTTHDGTPLSGLDTIIGQERLNELERNILADNSTGDQTIDRVADFNAGMAYTVWEYFSILSGTYIFYIIHLLGVPLILVLGITFIYSLFLIRTIVGLLRGV